MTRRDDARAVALGVAIGAVLVALTMWQAARTPAATLRGPYTITTYHQPRAVIDRQLVIGDGQAYAQLARDPTLGRPGLFRGGVREAAYRAQRPLLGWVVLVASGGRRSATGWALLAVNLLAGAVAALFVSRLGRRQGHRWWVGALVVALPGAVVAYSTSTSEVLGIAAVGAGLWFWVTRRSPAWPAVAFALGALCRETFVLVPVSLAVGAALTGDRRRVKVVLAGVPLACWLVVVRLRLGVWSFAAGDGRLGRPLAGIVAAGRYWTPADWAVFATLVLAAWRALRTASPLRQVALGQIALATVMGFDVWYRWQDFTRVLLPLGAVALVAVPRAIASRSGGSGDEATCAVPSTIAVRRLMGEQHMADLESP